MLGLASLLSASAWGALRADEGLALSEVVPGGSQEQAFLRAQGRYFGFFHMFAVTRGNFEYPTKQRLLLEYHEAFTSVEHVIKNDDGGLPDFWLTLFRDWLLGKENRMTRARHGAEKKEYTDTVLRTCNKSLTGVLNASKKQSLDFRPTTL